ncbi:GNAT family N-acetyltransferase [Tunturiibacter gelidiferens]|uniref:GNAT family N-acetyltransferase n=1 Tax=Tunturiibacter gelidiferens TaxID=3069689 RepID=UPI003D9BEBE5
MNPRTCEIKGLFVLPEQRAHGIGNSLVSTCIDRARAKGYQVACLDLEPETMAWLRGVFGNSYNTRYYLHLWKGVRECLAVPRFFRVKSRT